MTKRRDISAAPVVLEFLRQAREGADHLDVGKLWTAAGCPERDRPDAWADFSREAPHSRDPGLRRVGSTLTMNAMDAAFYACELDERLNAALHELLRCPGDAFREFLEDPTPAAAMLAIVILMSHVRDEWSPARAARHLMDTVLRTVSSVDQFTQETHVARAQRALRGEPTLWLPSAPARRRKR